VPRESPIPKAAVTLPNPLRNALLLNPYMFTAPFQDF
jgi:hypothetical protein